MASFKDYGSKEKKAVTISNFGGVDLTNAEGKINMGRSNCGTNMIRDTIGKIKKRFGYKVLNDFSECIYGIYYFVKESEKKMIVHSGKNLYIQTENGFEQIFSQMAENKSTAIQFCGKLIICDGEKLRYYDGETAGNMEDIAYVPTVVIGREANTGGGTFLDPVNMLTPKRKECFRSKGTNDKFYFTSENVKGIVSVRTRTSEGWLDNELYKHYGYSLSEGYVTLTYNLYPVDDDDNVEIIYYCDNDEYSRLVNSSTLMTLYGLNGSMDRVFIAGNSLYPNRDYYSYVNNPTYFPDINYNVFGRDDSPIMGYSLVSGKIAVHKYNEENNANIILREGAVNNDTVYFKMVGSYVCDGALSKHGFGVIDNEPAYLSDNGICAITPSDILGERYSQIRSYFINGQLLKEDNLENAYVVTHNQFFMLCINDKVYILDSIKYSSEGNNSFSHRQYEAYLWDNIPANVMLSYEDNLFFGTKDGRLCRFFSEEEENCYLDDGENFNAYWQFPDFVGDDFTFRKTIMRFSAMFDDVSGNTVLEYYDDGWKELIKKDLNENILSKRIHLKNTKNQKLRIRNSSNEPMKINTVQIIYKNSSKIK